MLSSGNQLRAARSLLGLEQMQLAEAAGVSVNTIRNMEAAGSGAIGGRVQSLRSVQSALEAAGVQFIPENGGGAGVRLAKPREG